jgi:hypothetical protein
LMSDHLSLMPLTIAKSAAITKIDVSIRNPQE